MSFFAGFKSFFDKVGNEIEKLFGGKASLEQKIQATITYVAPVLNTIVGLADPAVEPLVSKVISTVQSDLATVSTVVQGATVAPGSTDEQRLVAALNSIRTNLSGMLTAAEVKNTSKFNEIEAATNLVIGEVEAAAGSLSTSTAPAA